MKKYPKIKTIYKHNPGDGYKTVIEGEFATSELAFLRDINWEFTEKIDGCNVRVMRDGISPNMIRFGGRTDRATMPTPLVARLDEMFSPDAFQDAFDPDSLVCLYGEGYGAKTVKGGGKYIPDGVDFILFDVWVDGGNGNGIWLQRKDVEDVARKLSIDVVPLVWTGTLLEAAEMARRGFKSIVANTEMMAEGLVVRPSVELLDRRGRRIMAKIKYTDFPINEKVL